MPEYLIKSVEVLTLCAFPLVVFLMLKKKRYAVLAAMAMTLLTATIAELINEFLTRVTIYNSAFTLNLPRTSVPLFIIDGAAIISALIVECAILADRRFFEKPSKLRTAALAFILTIPLPLLEIIGTGSGMWKWVHECNIFSPFWLLGVWKYYFFVVSPAVIVCFFRHSKRLSEGE